MGATVREPDDSEPSKNEPLKRGSLRSELSEDGSLKRSFKRESLNRQSSKIELSKNQPSKDEPKNVDGGPSGRATEAPEPPLWKCKPRRGVFEGDVAIVELRSRLALAPDLIREPSAPNSTVLTFAALLRLTGGVLMAAAVAGVTAYLWSFGLPTKSTQRAPASGQANVLPTLATPTANLKVSNPDPEQPSGPAAAIGAPVDARGAAHDVTSVDAVQQSPPPAPAEDASEIAAKKKPGEDLTANGEIFRQFMLWREQLQRKQ